MENKLFYQDSYLQSFTSMLTKQVNDENGQWYVVLDKTAFYPTGGGQPFDTGLINNIPVVNVEEIDGEIRHYLSRSLDTNEKIIHGQIDWDRRFDHMQQHSGQHILSAAFEELFDLKTVGFHLGQEIVTIDLEVEDLDVEQAKSAEKLANQIVLENRTIVSKWVNGSELSLFPLRKQPTVSENIRLVIIPDFDYNGCGGIHPNSTSQVGSIKILNWERQRKKIRVQFVCGGRVLKQLQSKHDILMELTRLLNAPEPEMTSALKRLLDNMKTMERQMEETQQSLLKYEAIRLIVQAKMVNGKKIISNLSHQRSIKELQSLSRLIINEAEDAIVILVSENDQQLQLVLARGPHVEVSMKALIMSMLPLINGKGGGNDSTAQGGGEAIVTGSQLVTHGIDLVNRI